MRHRRGVVPEVCHAPDPALRLDMLMVVGFSRQGSDKDSWWAARFVTKHNKPKDKYADVFTARAQFTQASQVANALPMRFKNIQILFANAVPERGLSILLLFGDERRA